VPSLRERSASRLRGALRTRRGRAWAALALLPVLVLLLDLLVPPRLERARDVAFVLLDRHGEPLRYHLARDGMLRLPVRPEDVDPKLLQLLLAYEDQRFHWHPGVDPLALARAIGQAAQHGRIVSGASTLTMQVARLLEPRPRTLPNKVIEALRALQLEWHLDKHEILGLYLTLAPYGGNVEGVAAASRLWFGKPPGQLTPGEAALLVALPQSPTRLRPDRHPDAARAARAKVLARVGDRLREPTGTAGDDGHWNAAALSLAREEPIALRPQRLPFLAPHLADRFLAAGVDGAAAIDEPGAVDEPRSCIDADLQRRVEAITRAALPALNRRASVAALVIDNASAEVRAYVGNADYFAQARQGQVDVVRAVRSPGSTLKPFVYGLAFDQDIARPGTLTLDAPTRFGSYSPGNFEDQFHGTVTLIEALRRSLNVPAVTLLDAIGPVRFAGALADQGTPLRLPDGAGRPGLAVALGGVGMTLEDLARLYRGLADDGRARPLQLHCDGPTHDLATHAPGDAAAQVAGVATQPLLAADTRWHLRRILRNVAAPSTRPEAATLGGVGRIAQKTGTSYGFRDAWAFGYDARHTVAIWVGRPDGTPHPGHFGYATAAPLLFQVFDELPGGGAEPAPPVDAALAWENAALPQRLRYIGRGEQRHDGPRLLFPLPDATLLASDEPVQFEAEGGTPPYTWLVDGLPLATTELGRVQWRPPAAGFAVATVIDASGDYDRVAFRVGGGSDASLPEYGMRVGRLTTLR
jgi:penicillin-binding protein 1C